MKAHLLVEDDDSRITELLRRALARSVGPQDRPAQLHESATCSRERHHTRAHALGA